MATKVNTKFVIVLAASMVIMLGAAAFLATQILFKSPEKLAAMGETKLAEGDLENAILFYGRAVNKDPQNIELLETWLGLMEQWVPPTRAQFDDMFRSNYLAGIRVSSLRQKTNVEAQHRGLGTFLELYRLGSEGRGAYENLITETTTSLAVFEFGLGADHEPGTEPWEALRRYRGIARVTIMGLGLDLDEQEIDEALEDLRVALLVDPGDERSLIALTDWHIFRAQRYALDNQQDRRLETLAAARAYLDEHTGDHGASPGSELASLALDTNAAAAQVELSGLVDPFEVRAFRDRVFAPLRDRLPEVVRRVTEWAPRDYIDALYVNRIEVTLVDSSGAVETQRVLNSILEDAPGNTLARATLGRVLQQTTQNQAARDLLIGIEDTAALPISVAGFLQFRAIDNGVYERTRAELRLARNARAAEEPGWEDLLATADASLAVFRSRVAADTRPLLRLEAERSFLFDAPLDAQAKLAAYNTLDDTDGETLWWAGQLAVSMDQIGRAREAFSRAVEVAPDIPEIRLALGELEMRLNEFERALEIFEGILEDFPNNEQAQRYTANVRQILGLDRVDDPVQQLLLDAARIVRGTSAGPGDRTEAIELLMDNFDRYDRDPRLAQTIAAYYLELDRIAEARSVIASSLERHQTEELNTLAEVLDNPDRVEVQAQILLRGEESAENYLRAHLVYRGAGRTEAANRMLDEATRLDPLMPAIVEARFIRAVLSGREDDFARAKEIVELATTNNIDQVEGKSYQSRLAFAIGDTDLSITLLRDIVETGAAPAPVYRLLGNQLVTKGQVAEAAEAYRRSLEIMPSQPPVIVTYLQTLIRSGQPENALIEARSFQNQGSTDPEFVNLWLALEASYGDEELALQRREERLQRDQTDRVNREALARIYLDQRRWNPAAALIDGLREEEDTIGLLELKARWYAAQGDIDGARDEYIDKITSIGADDADQRVDVYVSLARFLISRGVPDQAINALQQVRQFQNRDTLNIDRMLGDAYAQAGGIEQALEIYRGIVAAGADTDEQLFQKRAIDMLLRLGRVEEGSEVIGRLLAAQPEDLIYLLQDAEFSRLAAERALVDGDTESAAGHRRDTLAKLDKAIRTHPQAETAYLKRAEMQLGMSIRAATASERQTLERDALRNLDEAIRLNAGLWNARQLRAQTYYTQGRINEAIDEFQQALRLRPTMDDLRARLMIELLGMERTDSAVALATEAIEARPGDLQLIMRMGRVFADRGLWRPAATIFGIGWQTTQNRSFGSIYVDSLLNQDPPQTTLARDTLVELRDAGIDINGDPALLILQAVVLHELNSVGEARELMVQAFEVCDVDRADQFTVWALNLPRIIPDSGERVQLLDQMAGVYASDPARARWASLLQTQILLADPERSGDGVARLGALARDPSTSPAQALRAYAELGSHFQDDDPTRAIEIWREGLEKFRNEPQAWALVNNIAFLLIGQGELDEALRLAQEAVELAGPTQADPLDTLGWAYTKLGRFEEAEESLRAAGEVARTLGQAYTILYHQIQAAVAQNDTQKARVRCERYLRQMQASPNMAEERAEQTAEVRSLLNRL